LKKYKVPTTDERDLRIAGRLQLVLSLALWPIFPTCP